MTLDDSGMPALAFLQMLDSEALGGHDASNALRSLMVRDHVTESMLVGGRDAQVPYGGSGRYTPISIVIREPVWVSRSPNTPN